MRTILAVCILLVFAISAFGEDKVIIVYLKPSTAARELVYVEVTPPPPKSKLGQMGSLDMSLKKDAVAEVRQGDTLHYRYLDANEKWADDSSWKVLAAVNMGAEIKGNEKNKDKAQKTDGRFIGVAFQLTNDGQAECLVPSPQIVDEKDRSFGQIPNNDDFIPDQYIDPHLATIRPGFTRTYCAIYEVPKTAANLKLQIPTFNTYKFEGVDMPMGLKKVALVFRK